MGAGRGFVVTKIVGCRQRRRVNQVSVMRPKASDFDLQSK